MAAFVPDTATPVASRGPRIAWPAWLLSCATIACASLAFFATAGAPRIVAFGLTVFLVAALGLQAMRATTIRPDPSGDDSFAAGDGDGRLDRITRLLSGVLPVWHFQVEAIRSQTEEAVTGLAMSFGAINARFGAAGFQGTSANAGNDANKFSLLTLCERELQPVVASMMTILDSKAALVASVSDLAGATHEMRDMAGDVGRIAAHTNILAINAAIAAAHAGEAGRSFAVIAAEIRSLSQTSADAAHRIADRMSQVERRMQATLETAERTSLDDKQAVTLSGNVIEDVLGHVRELGHDAERMRTQGNEIKSDTEQLLMSLQFQDRVSQMGVVLGDNMRKLQAVAEDDVAAVPGHDQWQAELGARYTMDDQRRSPDRPGKAPETQSADNAEVVFF